jgi:uncharacterized glyoxalase superfamily protein PhnB
VIGMTTIESITLGAADVPAAESFYSDAFELDGGVLRLEHSDADTEGFRGFTLSLLVSQPADVEAVVDAAVGAGASTLKPVAKSLWGCGGVVQAPDGAIWKVATAAKKNTAPARRTIQNMVLLLGVDDVAASKRFYAARGLAVAKSFGSYVEFATPGSRVGLGLYKRRALAKDAGVAPDGSGSHRITINGDAGGSTDPDGFLWR